MEFNITLFKIHKLAQICFHSGLLSSTRCDRWMKIPQAVQKLQRQLPLLILLHEHVSFVFSVVTSGITRFYCTGWNQTQKMSVRVCLQNKRKDTDPCYISVFQAPRVAFRCSSPTYLQVVVAHGATSQVSAHTLPKLQQTGGVGVGAGLRAGWGSQQQTA